MRHSDRHAPRADVPVTPRLYRHPHGITAVDTEYLYPGHAAAHVIVRTPGARRSSMWAPTTRYPICSPRSPSSAWRAQRGRLPAADARAPRSRRRRRHADARAAERAGAAASARRAAHDRPDEASSPAPWRCTARSASGACTASCCRSRRRGCAWSQDGERVRLGARTLELVHTPGHAAASLRGGGRRAPRASSPATPSAFPTARSTPRAARSSPRPRRRRSSTREQLLDSIDRMLGYGPESMYLMHFSRVTRRAAPGRIAQGADRGSLAAIGARARRASPTRPPESAPTCWPCGCKLAREHGVHAAGRRDRARARRGPDSQRPGPHGLARPHPRQRR